MNASWLSEVRKIPDEVMNDPQCLAVRAVKEQGHSPEWVAPMFGISRSRLYEWPRRDRAHGAAALDTRTAPGAPRVITRGMDGWWRKTGLTSTPVDRGNDPLLWPRQILAERLEKRLEIYGAESTVSLRLRGLDWRVRPPGDRALERKPAEVQAPVDVQFPKIQRLATHLDANLAFEDEAGISLRAREKKWSFFLKKRKERTESRARVSLERQGNEQIERISKVAYRTRWLQSI
jgi:transposase